jgi:hypothetical protein
MYGAEGIILNHSFRNNVIRFGLEPSGFGWSPVMDFYGNSDEPSCSLKFGNIIT